MKVSLGRLKIKMEETQHSQTKNNILKYEDGRIIKNINISHEFS